MTIVSLEAFQNLGEKIDYIMESSGTDVIDAIITYCEDNKLEIETVGEIITKNPILKEKVMAEAESLHYLKKEEEEPVLV